MCRIGAQIVEGKKQDAVATLPITSKDVPFSGVEASQMVGRDLLSVLGELPIIWLVNYTPADQLS